MNLFKRNSINNLLLLAIFLAIASLFNLVSVNKAMAANGLAQTVKQVKVANSSTVYYLDHKLGVKKAYVSAAAYLSYGNKWSDIKVISRAQLDKWPDLKLIKSAGEKNIYYIKGDKKTLIKGPSDFSKFGLDYGRIAAINKTDFSLYQTVDYASVGLSASAGQIALKAGGGSPGSLTIELDADSQAGFLPMNTKHNLVATFNFKAGGAAVEIKQIILNLKGVYQPEVIEKVSLTNEAGYNLGEVAGLNNRQAVFSFGTSPLILAAGEIKKIKVYLDLNSYADFINHSVKASIESLKDVKTNVEINGSFPIEAKEFKLAVGFLMGQAEIDEITLNAGGKLVIGDNQRIIGKFKIIETSGNENMIIKKIALVNLGSARSSDLINFKLKDSNNNLIAQAQSMEGDAVIFNLNNYLLSKGQDKTFFLSADIIGGDNNQTVNFNLRDFYATGDSYGYGLSFSQTDAGETYTIGRESISVLSASLNPSKSVFSKQNGVLLGNFQVRNNNQKVKLSSVNVKLEKSSDAASFNDAVYLVNYDSGEVYAATDASKLPGGVSLSFNNLALEPRQTLNFSLVANLPAAAKSGDKYRIIINSIIYGYENVSYFSANLALAGNYLVVTKSSLYIYTNNDDSWGRDYIKGQKNVKIASFILEAAAGDDINISQITLAKSGDTSGSVLYENGFSNLRLYIGGSRVGSAISKPSASTYVFDNFNYRLSQNGRWELKLYADTEKDLKASEVQMIVLSVGAKSKTSNVPATIAGLNAASRKVYFGGSEAEILAVEGGSFTPGVKDNNIARFTITNNGAEDIKLNSLNIVTTADGLSYSLGFSDLTVVEASGSSKLGRISRPVAGANKIGLNSYTVKTSQTAEFNIRVTAGEEVPENGFDVYLTDLKITGKKSGLEAAVSGDPTDKVTVNNTSPSNGSGGNDDNAIQLAWPVNSQRVNYGFHDSNYPYRSVAEHDGIDIDVDQGTSVKTAAAGTVAEVANTHTTQYNYVIIDHGNGIKTVYGHLSEIAVNQGDTVASNQVIGLSGGLPGSIGSGSNTNGPHLHFGVLQDGVAVDPMAYLD
ncbi:MAG: M23 family metallopeptidase [Patescibacteria group bacterium]|nr:M23 family metallopeptidase [Patescibacteria group bacterium]